MIEPSKQIEIQLGHLCNNRCVFCVSGQMSERKLAGQVPVEPVIAELHAAHEKGFQRVTFLGGEPTIQRSFYDAIRTATELGFPEIVIFTNGVMASKERFLDRVLAIGNFTWRFSIQGATAKHHDAVTENEGSFDRIIRAIRMLRDRGQRVTANMCVTTQNLESLSFYPALVEELGVEQLHLDMVRPLDAGDRTDDYLEGILPRYSDMRGPLSDMLAEFDPDFDVNIGNFPYCLLPEHLHRIHHDGEWTLTVAANGRNQLETGWDKYEVKRRDKSHPKACETCVFKSRCNGLFDKYLEIHGNDEPQTVTYEALLESDKERQFFVLLMEAALSRVENVPLPSPEHTLQIHRDEPSRAIHLVISGDKGVSPIHCSVLPAGEMALPDGQSSLFDFRVEWGLGVDTETGIRLAERLFEALCGEDFTSTQPLDSLRLHQRGRLEHRLLRHAEKLLRFAREEDLDTPQVQRSLDGLDIAFQLEADQRVTFGLRLPVETEGRIGVSYGLDAPTTTEDHRAFITRAMNSLRGARASSKHA